MGNWKFSQAYALDLKKKYSIGAENNQDIPTKSDIINDFINKSQEEVTLEIIEEISYLYDSIFGRQFFAIAYMMGFFERLYLVSFFYIEKCYNVLIDFCNKSI